MVEQKNKMKANTYGRPSKNFLVIKKRVIYCVQPTYSTAANKNMQSITVITVSEPNAFINKVLTAA